MKGEVIKVFNSWIMEGVDRPIILTLTIEHSINGIRIAVQLFYSLNGFDSTNQENKLLIFTQQQRRLKRYAVKSHHHHRSSLLSSSGQSYKSLYDRNLRL